MNLRTFVMLAVACALVASAVLVPAQAETETQAQVKNMEPQVTAAAVVTDDDPDASGAQVDPVPGGVRVFDVEFTAEDRNHHEDIAEAACSVHEPDGTFVETLNASMTSGAGKSSQWALSASFGYDAPPGQWSVTCEARDHRMTAVGIEPSANNTFTAHFEVRAMAAILIQDAVVDFTGGQEMEPGTTTDATSVVIENQGNVQVDLLVNGTDLVGDQATIGVERVSYGLDQAMSNASALSGESTTVAGFDLPPGEGETKPLWWTLTIPSGDEQFIPAGTYAGQVRISAVQDSG